MRKLNEKIYGNQAVVYHCTKSENLPDVIYHREFSPAKRGNMYGDGMYCVYDDDTLGMNFEKGKSGKLSGLHYGDYVVKLSVKMDDFLILDYEPFTKNPLYRKLNNPSKEDFIVSQIEYFGIQLDKGSAFEDDFDKYIIGLGKKEFSANLAQFLASYTDVSFGKVNGMVFSGWNDGRVLICYNTRVAVPLAYRNGREDGEWIPVTKNLEYIGERASGPVKMKESIENPQFENTKIVDKDGQPLTVYHGTENLFDVFSLEHAGESSGNQGFLGKGFYFTPSKKMALAYGNIREYNLAMENPLILEGQIGKIAKELNDALFDDDTVFNESMNAKQVYSGLTSAVTDNPEFGAVIRDCFINAGYDGVWDKDRDEIVAFYPDQIKRI